MALPIADRWLSVDEVASYLGIKRDTVYKGISRQDLPAHKVGRLWKFRKQEIDDWVCSKHDPSPPPKQQRPSSSEQDIHDDSRRT
jgi:excisionase family DNA binding protein